MCSQAIFRAVDSIPLCLPRFQNRDATYASNGLPCLQPRVALTNLRMDMSIKASLTMEKSDCREAIERCLQTPAATLASSSTSAMAAAPVMSGRSGGSAAVTLEKSKSSKKAIKHAPETATGDGGGGIGKIIRLGGGGGDGDDGGDDDDYLGDFNDDDEGEGGGLFQRRSVFQEIFDPKFVNAVMEEWCKTMADLPVGLRQACEMGLVSSVQMVRYLSINARPTTARFVSRALPQSLSRAFIGRMIADPSFLFKLLLEEAATVGFATWREFRARGERIREEWDLALINVLASSLCTAIAAWSLAPCRSYGNTFHLDLQNSLQVLPNNIFEKSYPLREFDLQKRVRSFFYKTAELCSLGLAVGAAQGILLKLCFLTKKSRIPVINQNLLFRALGCGAFLGIHSNMRYQVLYGIDRKVFEYFDALEVVTAFSTSLRLLNVHLGESSVLTWLEAEYDPMTAANHLSNLYGRWKDSHVLESISGTVLSGLTFLSGGPTPYKRASRKKMTSPAW